ncbi:MAG: TetR/AcrR family transcriptional regulator [Paracoccus sp. (in: a-proteobacteria)]|uniref:TetR/AcrR family transcriptional regulator n=1 Tax=Paracoccus sp. TaxID=267 RepID=UPI0026E0CD6D|nr:TetR/AcrR family transcriptional regulator [Paracoccus sp. (in: a-proteobacteria)]MDO5632780.1 TetR/AcrR family transcriptional regulator [Paracoccus sp. (in: a-proteobacteria)]
MAGRDSYHHGNLREALVQATAILIAEVGPQSFTLAEAARRAGVSAAAPYRHFTGRDDLLEEVARQGFEAFADRLHTAFDDGKPNPLAAFLRTGQAYLDFARESPGHYIAMFESGISITGNAALSRASDQARGVIMAAASALFAHLPADQRPPATMVANHVWALSHGVVELFGRGKPGARAPYSPAEMLESGVLIYLRGLGLLPQ